MPPRSCRQELWTERGNEAMSEVETDPVLEKLRPWLGKPLGKGGPNAAPDAVNLPMIRHWVAAFDDRNPAYLDEESVREGRFGELVAPPAMLQTWTMPVPILEGIGERGGAPTEIDSDNPLGILDEAGYPATLATNSELEFERYLRVGDELTSESILESVSERKKTGIGPGYFVTWINIYRDRDGELVGRQIFRVLKFNPGGMA